MLHDHVDLAAEPAADGGGHHPDPAHLQPEQPGEVDPHREGVLGGRPDGQLAVCIVRGQGRMGLDGAVVDGGQAVPVLKDQVGLLHARVHIALIQVDDFRDVASLMDGVGALFHSLFRVDVEGQLFIFHLDELERLLRDLYSIGGHRGHLVAHIADHLVKDALVLALVNVLAAAVEGTIGGVLIADHRAHAGQGFRPAGVDALDPGMGHRAEEHLGMQHMGHLHIGYVFELTGDLDLCVPHPEAASNHSVGRSFTAHMFCVLSCILVMRCACAQRPGGWPPRSSHIPCSGTGCWRSRRGSPPQRGPDSCPEGPWPTSPCPVCSTRTGPRRRQ